MYVYGKLPIKSICEIKGFTKLENILSIIIDPTTFPSNLPAIGPQGVKVATPNALNESP
jgi:hypothetical protein